MAIFTGTTNYEKHIEVLVDHEGLYAPLSITVDPTKLSPDTAGQKRLEPGEFLAVVAGFGRKLPRTRLALATATNSSAVSVDNHTPFIGGDVISALAVGMVTLAATWASGDTLAVTLGDRTQTITADSATLAEIATAAANELNAGAIGTIATVVASGAVLFIQVSDLTVRPLSAVATTDGNGTATTAAVADRPLGTIQAASANSLTLSANAATALPAGLVVGVAGAEVKGLNIRPTDLLSTKDIDAIAAYTSGHIRKARLPYLDGEIEAKFPNLQFL